MTSDMPQGPFSSKKFACIRLNNEELTVLVKRAWGHVPHRKFRQTFSSDHTRLALATPIASGPIICCSFCCSNYVAAVIDKSIPPGAFSASLLSDPYCWTCCL